MAVKILHKRSAVEFKSATGAQLELGELALNYNESGPYLQCKDAAGEIAQLGGVYIGASAPGNELKGAWWLRDTDSTLFLYDGTRWVSIAGGGGGGGTGDITEVIGGDGIKATELVGVVTVEVDLAADSHGLSIVGGKLQADIATTSSLGTVKIGDGIDVDASGEISVDLSGVDVNADLEYVPDGNNNAEITNTAGDDATVPIAIQADSDATPTPTAGVAGLFTGLEKEKLAGIEAGAQVNGVPVTISDTAPVDPADGDLWWNSSNNSGRLYVYYKDANSSQWVESSPQGDTLTESDADVLYLSKVSDDTAAGEITFEKVTTHEVGIKTNKASSLNGSNVLFISQDDAVAFQFDSTSVVDGAGTSSGALFSFSTTDLFQKPTNGVSSYIEDGAKNVDAISCFNANLGTSVASDNFIAGFKSSVNNGANTSGAGKEYNFYAAGTAPSFFQGLTEHASGVKVTGSGVTTEGTDTGANWGGVNAAKFLARGASTATSAQGFAATQLTSGTDNIVTNFLAQGADNQANKTNYGFRSNLSATGTNGAVATNYNFYASGDAPNYFNGAVKIGNPDIATEAAERLATNYVIKQIRANEGPTTRFYIGPVAAAGLGNAVSTIEITSAGAAFSDTSDYRLKTNITPLPSAVESIKSLKPCSFTMRGTDGIKGFVAHELQEVLPEAVKGTKDETEAIGTLTDYDGTVLQTAVAEPDAEELEYTEEVETDGVTTQTVRTRTWTPTGTRDVYQGVSQTKLIPLLTKALQEVLAKNEELETRIAALEGA